MSDTAETTDAAKIKDMVDWLRENPDQVQVLEQEAGTQLPGYPSNGCAITLWILLEWAGIDLPRNFMALGLGKELEQRGWTRIKTGEQQAGDVGSTCGLTPRHGIDHIYFVLDALNPTECRVVDNQASYPHFRYTRGHGKSPTTHFLRAPKKEAV